ncbi:MAG TPA: zinc ribbon domain-containing protein [Baekduia sp.]|nr:zinc ribbon domain-containing protein [Baekduia sp.]
MITESQPVPVFGRDGEPCPACGAPLAGDQRYCMHCGARRPEARLEFLDVLDADVRARSLPVGPAWSGAGVSPIPSPGALSGAGVPPGGGVAWPAPHAAAQPQGFSARLQANAGLLALGALLLLMLLIGLLVGHWATGSSSPTAAATPAPQVITVAGAAAPAGGSTGSSGTSGASSSKGSSSTAKAKDTSTTATTPKGSVSVNKLTDKKAIDSAVKKGKSISTGTGKLPATDNKPAGGGSSFETIG